MASRIKQIYIDLQAIFESIKDSNGKTLFQYINVWDNQIEMTIAGDTYSFATPSVFVEFNLGEAKPLMGGFTSYPATTINFHLVHVSLNVNDKMEQNLEVFDLRDAVSASLNKKALTFCSAMMPNGEQQDFKHNNVYKYTLSFITNFIDNKNAYNDDGKKVFGYLTNPTLNLNVFKPWISEKEYKDYTTSLINVVTYRGSIYLCAQDNEDVLFDVNKWIAVKPWIPPTKYIVTDFVCFNSGIYICITENEDAIFDESKWSLIFQP